MLKYSHTLFVFLALGVLLSACQPSYVANTSREWSRTVGVTDHYQIYRQSSFGFSWQSSIDLAASSCPEQGCEALLKIMQQAFDPYFGDVTYHAQAMPRDQAAKRAQGQLLVYLRRFNADQVKTEPAADSTTQPTTDAQQAQQPQQSEEPRFRSADLIIDVIDAGSGRILDSASVHASGKSWWLGGQSMDDLLTEALQQLALDWSGKAR